MRFTEAAITEAMEDLATTLAVELDYESVYEPQADDDIGRALREPVSMGAVLNDLCMMLGIDPPGMIRRVLDVVWD